jgi:hypothetical protein
VAWFSDVIVTTSGGSFFRFDPDCTIEAKGSAYVDPKNGGVIHDWRSTYIVNSTGIERTDNDLNFESGSSLICRRQRPNDPNPKIVYKSFFRHDYPTILLGQAPAKVIIDGLDIYGDLSAPRNLKIYFGTAAITSANNVRFFNAAKAQQCNSTYNDFYFEQLSMTSENANLPIVQNRPTYYQATPAAFSGGFRGAIATLNNPTFLNNCWNGLVEWNPDVNTGSRFSLQYSYVSAFRSGLTAVEGVNVRFTRARESITANPSLPTWADPDDAVLTAISDAEGTFSDVNLLDAYRAGTDRFNIERFNWTAKARTYDRRTAGETFFASRVLYQHSVDMSAGYSEEVQMLDVPHLTLTQAQAAALTGIALTASGATGGTVTVSGTVTASDLWHYYRQWISQTANFDSNDTWTFDGATLNIGAWDVVVSAGATLTANFVTTGAVSGDGEIVGSYTDASGSRVTIRTESGTAFTARLAINGVTQDTAHGVTGLPVTVQTTDTVRIAIAAFGRQARVIDTTGAALVAQATFALDPAPAVDITTPQATLDALAGTVDSYVTTEGEVSLLIGADLSAYTPDAVVAGLQYWLVTEGGSYFAALLETGQADIVSFSRGRVTINTAGFFAQPSEAWGVSLTVPDRGVSVPVVIQSPIDGARPVRPNGAGVILCTSPWTQQEAEINEGAIAGAVWAAPTRTLNGALFA